MECLCGFLPALVFQLGADQRDIRMLFHLMILILGKQASLCPNPFLPFKGFDQYIAQVGKFFFQCMDCPECQLVKSLGAAA